MSQVSIQLYDLSQGMAKNLSQQFLGKKIDGIWHTGIIVFGKEYYFGGGICCDKPNKTPYGSPIKNIPMGETQIPEDVFNDFLKEISPKFTVDKYDLFENNCNNFTDECCEFLVGEKIPSYITGLPKEVLNTPFGKMIKPMVDQMQKGINQNSHPMNLPGMFEGNNNQSTLNFGNNSGNNFGNFGNFNQNTTQNTQKTESVVENVTKIERFYEICDDTPGVIVDFFSYSCRPCIEIKPYFESLAKEFSQRCPGLKFISVDTAQAREIAGQMKIQAIPTFIGFFQGNIVKRFQGAIKRDLESLAYTIEAKINGGTKESTASVSDEFKLLNPSKKDFYLFKGDNYGMAVNAIKSSLEKAGGLDSDGKTVFLEFASNPVENVKNFNLDKKIALVNWLFETAFFLEISDKTIGFFDLLRMLSLTPAFLDVIFKYTDKIDLILDFFDKDEKSLQEIQRGLKLVLLRFMTNLSSAEKGLDYFKANAIRLTKVLIRAGEAYITDKASLNAILMNLWNLVQNFHSLNEFGDVRPYVADFVTEAFGKTSDSENLLPCVLTLGWLTYSYKDVRKQVEGKINKGKLAKLEFETDNESVAKLSIDLTNIFAGKFD